MIKKHSKNRVLHSKNLLEALVNGVIKEGEVICIELKATNEVKKMYGHFFTYDIAHSYIGIYQKQSEIIEIPFKKIKEVQTFSLAKLKTTIVEGIITSLADDEKIQARQITLQEKKKENQKKRSFLLKTIRQL